MSNDEALRWLVSRGYFWRFQALQWSEWNPRPAVERRRAEARAELPEQERQLAELESEEQAIHNQILELEPQLRAGQADRQRLQQLLQRVGRLRRQLQSRREQVREEADAELARIARSLGLLSGSGAPADLRQQVQDLLAAARRRATALQNRVGPLRRTETALDRRIAGLEHETDVNRAMLNPDPPESVDNPNALTVNLNHLRVEVKYTPHSRPQRESDPLDPVFAVAVMMFLEDAQLNGVQTVYSAGMNRQPMSPQDTHPQGKAWDIKGFRVEDTDLLLRSGRMLPPSDPQHSDWFDIESHLPDGTSHAERLYFLVTDLFPRYFGQAIGPGHNPEHAAHFHVQLTGRDAVYSWPATLSNPRPYRTTRSAPRRAATRTP